VHARHRHRPVRRRQRRLIERRSAVQVLDRFTRFDLRLDQIARHFGMKPAEAEIRQAVLAGKILDDLDDQVDPAVRPGIAG